MIARIDPEFLAQIDTMGAVELHETIEDLEGQLEDAKKVAHKLVQEVKWHEENQNKAKSEDRMATEKANRNMRANHKRTIEPLLEKIARAKVLLITKFGED